MMRLDSPEGDRPTVFFDSPASRRARWRSTAVLLVMLAGALVAAWGLR